MHNFNVIRPIAFILAVLAPISLAYQMACTYGERGSLTVNCVNATSTFFKVAPYRFDHLDETLKCINCSLGNIDSGTFDISGNQIKTLDIRNSSVTQISYKAFIGLIFMEKLLLSNNPITLIYPGAFTGVRKVKYLELENATNSLEPEVFQELRLLEILILKNNKISTLKPATFDGLGNLKILDLSYNQLTKLEDSFSPLVSLRSLKLQGNRISRIYGNEFNNLKALLLLNLENNILANFTMNIDSDNHLRILNLGKNTLSTDGIKMNTFLNLNSLEELDLSNNIIKKIPPKFFLGLYHLRILNLNNNQISEFTTGTFSGLPHLQTLNLAGNDLKSASVSGRLLLHSLHTLNLSYNLISKFDYLEFVSRMPRITTIYLANNDLSCETISEIETLFVEDKIRFVMSDANTELTVSCPPSKTTAKEIIDKLVAEKLPKQEGSTSTTVFIILLTIIVSLVALLFYVQFFVLYRMQSPAHRIQIV